jgi:hypothetical protein
MDQEMQRPMTETEQERIKSDISTETITVERIWKKRQHGSAMKMPTNTKTEELVILKFKRMSCDGSIRYTGKKCSDDPIHIHKILTRTNTPPSTMDCESEKLHGRGKVSKRKSFTPQPNLLQGPGRRNRIN